MRYVPGLDGLRALSVTAVLLYHADVTWMPGGFLGVDVFFAISGYLITSLLLAEYRNRGDVNIGSSTCAGPAACCPRSSSCSRRVSLFAVIFLPDEVRSLRGDVVAALGYATNWWQIFQHQSYVAAQGRPPLLRHLWSLAVEEQFYLVWPLMLFAMLRIWKGRRTPMLLATLGIASSLRHDARARRCRTTTRSPTRPACTTAATRASTRCCSARRSRWCGRRGSSHRRSRGSPA